MGTAFSIRVSTDYITDFWEIIPGEEGPKTYTEVIELLERAQRIIEDKRTFLGDKIEIKQ